MIRSKQITQEQGIFEAFGILELSNEFNVSTAWKEKEEDCIKHAEKKRSRSKEERIEKKKKREDEN